MNKFLLFLPYYLLLTTNIVAQNNDPIVKTEFREYRFGIRALSSLGWLTPLQQKIYSKGKLGLGFGWGFTVEKNFNQNTSIRTGFSISTFKAGVNYYDDNLSLNHKTYYVLDAQEESTISRSLVAHAGGRRSLMRRRLSQQRASVEKLTHK